LKRYILTLDEGTTSARAVLFDSNAKLVTMAQHEFTQIYPQPGFVEHNPIEIFSSQYSAMTEAVINSGIEPSQIAAIGITNQRETTVVWDKNTGEPIYNAIVWQCRRTADICEELISQGLSEYISEKTGLLADAYFSATKIKWILDNVEGAREKAENGELLFGTVDTWLLWKLSGGAVHATDYTNAARTMLFDINTLSWDEKLLKVLSIPKTMLPKVFHSGHRFCEIEFMGAKIPVCSMVGDQQAALFGQRCFSAGEVKNTYGTGCFLLMNTGETAIKSQNGLVTTLAASLDGMHQQYALEGSVFVGGAVIQWLRDELKLIENAQISEKCARKVPNSGGVYIVPAFAGLGAPYWEMYAKGSIFGLTRGSNKNHIVRAALESIAYQTDDLIRAMRADSGLEISSLKADGGASANSFLMQFQADISGIEVACPKSVEATALGAAFLAGITVGFWDNTVSINKLEMEAAQYKPFINEEERTDLLDGWLRAVAATKCFIVEK